MASIHEDTSIIKRYRFNFPIALLSALSFTFYSCGSGTDAGARSVDALMMNYFDALSTKDVKAFRRLTPPVDLSWGVYDDADRADEKEFRKTAKEKLESLEEAFEKAAEELGGVKVSVTNLEAEAEVVQNVVWSAEPYGKVGKVVVTAMREGREHKFTFNNVMQYRGKYYLEESPFVDMKRWE